MNLESILGKPTANKRKIVAIFGAVFAALHFVLSILLLFTDNYLLSIVFLFGALFYAYEVWKMLRWVIDNGGWEEAKYLSWILVSDRLPEKDGGYLTTYDAGGGKLEVAEFYLHTNDWSDDPSELGQRTWEAGGDGYPSNIPVLAWMGLPKPCKILDRYYIQHPVKCPCELADSPCDPRCSCINAFSSVGCSSCAGYGSNEQRRAAANFIVKATSQNAE
jgi:hypothetical protein